MTPANYRVRRATVEDLSALKELWTAMQLPAADLERRLTEFQLVQAADGKVVGSIGVQFTKQHAWLHSEAYSDFAIADAIRPLLFERIQSLASNHGVFRLWMQDASPFWTHQGFQIASDETLARLPEQWRSAAHNSKWLSLQLKDEAAIVSLEKQLAMYMETEKRNTERTLEKARTLRTVVTVIALSVGIILMGLAAYLYYARYVRR